jgi:hypothetical protein
MTTRYCTLYRLGYWCSIEAECRTEPSAEFPELIDHKVTFVLINKFGDRSYIDCSLFTGQTDRLSVFDEDGETFPALAAAIRAHAARLVKITETPGLWRDKPARYDTWQGTVATAFDLAAS